MIEFGGASSSKGLESFEIQARLKKIKLLALDVDGILTDGRVFWVEKQGWTRQFHIHDGYGIKLLMSAGIELALISGGNSEDLRVRAQHLNIQHIYLGDEDKLKSLEKILGLTGFQADQIAYMGDDLFDIPALERVGFSATVPQAVEAVKRRVHYITQTPGGWGAVREVADAIRKAQGLGPYLSD